MNVRDVSVRDVIERNDCAGRKTIEVTAMEEDETISSRFRLTHAYMLPREKLALASVAPMDFVSVAVDNYGHDPLLLGEYVANKTDIQNRDPICLCNTQMVSDGFDVYCPNTSCFLTLEARLNRLGNIVFFSPDAMDFNENLHLFTHQEISFTDSMNFYKPFFPITQGRFWGEPGGSLAHALRNTKCTDVSIATFLIEPYFHNLVSVIGPHFFKSGIPYANIMRFYGEMDEFVNRRDYDSERQNRLYCCLIQSLGIESLTLDHIHDLLIYERLNNQHVEPLLATAWALTHPEEMVREMGLHPLEASAIRLEVKRRKDELYLIFQHYVPMNNDVDIIFNKMT